MAQEPPTVGSSKPSCQEPPNEAQSPILAPEEEETRASQGPTVPIPKNDVPSQSKEHISLGSKIGVESSEEGDTEASSLSGSPDQPKRGRKTEKKRREEQSYKDVVQGSQHTIPEMMNTRSGLKHGKTPKGANPSHSGK